MVPKPASNFAKTRYLSLNMGIALVWSLQLASNCNAHGDLELITIAHTQASAQSESIPVSAPQEPPVETADTAATETHEIPPIKVTSERGWSSWYGRKFNGRKTASGQRFDMMAFTAAHRSLPLNSYVRITVLETGTQVIVRITDRGPYAKNRIIDISWASAQVLGILNKGVAQVMVEPIAASDQNPQLNHRSASH